VRHLPASEPQVACQSGRFGKSPVNTSVLTSSLAVVATATAHTRIYAGRDPVSRDAPNVTRRATSRRGTSRAGNVTRRGTKAATRGR
jgi:hypothetical protein